MQCLQLFFFLTFLHLSKIESFFRSMNSLKFKYYISRNGNYFCNIIKRTKIISNSATTITSLDTSSLNDDMYKAPYSKDISNTIYPTLDFTDMLVDGAVCVVVKSPTPNEFEFDPSQNYTHDQYDVNNEEIAFGYIKEQHNKARINKFLGGRVALRRALKGVHALTCPSILRDDFGAPTLPMEITGSISHKDDLAVGVARVDSIGRIGVDLEHTYNKAASRLWGRILTKNEQSQLGKLAGVTMEEEVLLRFSLKEAGYKAIHPFLKRSVDFSEVEVNPMPDGSATVNFFLHSGESFSYKACWQKYREKYWLTCVYVWDPLNQLPKYR